MKKRSLLNRIDSEKGTATVMVLCVILLLTALGTVALAASALNVSLSGKVMKWTQEYYGLDTQTETYVKSVDQQLIAAENDARAYVQGRYDKMLPDELPTDYIEGVYDMDNDMDNGSNNAQKFFHAHYQAIWTRTDRVTGPAIEITGAAIEITPQDYADDPDLLESSDSYKEDNTLTAEEAFSKDVHKYTNELFDRVYFFMLSKRLEALSQSSSGAIVLEAGSAHSADLCTYKFTNFGFASWDSIAPADGDIKLTINVSNHNTKDPKEVHARISVVKPHYESIVQTINSPVYGNPVWANAITAGGNITITSGSSVKIDGDVYASGTEGILVDGAGDNVIRGNVYTRGDLAIVGNNGKLRVETGTSGVSYDKKRLIYNNEYFFDTSSLEIEIADFTAGNSSASGMPFFFNDLVDRDNVYCNNLLVKEGVEGAAIKIDGNIWTKDDIQMDGRGSSIRIGTTTANGSSVVPLTSYIGLNQFSYIEDSDKMSNDPNTSSSIINNFPYDEDGITEDSKIIINSNFVVPGVAFYDFKGGPGGYPQDYSYGGRYYYKSAESVSARTTSPAAIISAYYYDSTRGGASGNFTGDDDVDYKLITPSDEINDKKTALNSFIGSNGVKTDILTNLTSPAGFVAGAALLQKPEDTNAQLYTSTTGSGIYLSDSNRYLADYSRLQSVNALMKAFDSKTGQFGRNAASGFEDLLGSDVPDSLSEIIDRTEEGTLDISSDPASGFHEGIVYCNGNLTITGDGTFNGTIICTGNVTITGSPTIVYDENVIVGKLKAYKAVRDFFAKGNTGNVIDNIHDYSSTSGERTVLKRYKILSWQEKSPVPGA